MCLCICPDVFVYLWHGPKLGPGPSRARAQAGPRPKLGLGPSRARARARAFSEVFHVDDVVYFWFSNSQTFRARKIFLFSVFDYFYMFLSVSRRLPMHRGLSCTPLDAHRKVSIAPANFRFIYGARGELWTQTFENMLDVLILVR